MGVFLVLGGNAVVVLAEQWVPSGLTALLVATEPVNLRLALAGGLILGAVWLIIRAPAPHKGRADSRTAESLAAVPAARVASNDSGGAHQRGGPSGLGRQRSRARTTV